MKTSILSLALGVVLAGPVSAYATERAYVPAPSQRIVDYLAVVPYGDSFAAPNTGAGANAHARLMRREGLSRSASACAKYGCLGF